MKNANTAKAWDILIDRKGERKESRIAFIAALIMDLCGPITPNEAEAYAVEFVRLAGRIKAEAEAACSYERSPAQEKAGEALEARFAALANALGFESRTGGDPRGACAYLIDSDNRKGDGWGEGFAVYA